MEEFYLNLIGSGFSDEYISLKYQEDIVFHKKGDVWRSRTGELYASNFFKYRIKVVYEIGFLVAIDHLIENIDNDQNLKNLVFNSSQLEVQISISLDENIRVPHFHMTPSQMLYFANIGAELDLHIS
ncbi:hypothetical protein Q9L42_013460 [Methylomarinum sp. Ch1-1]|uniref:DUF4279 domain-containing protein n=1 Tax=Methylomarinum roseum TaxID=3067653 RepID=A0AAU7NRY3_9GAMM|nr:hypothetical protein [Methylomarinum sp. Ch1-1]MDP4520672.1 hypothetical protein [Methylomarinum sp. Ch1-1]MDP4523094.1 hypothetical protein [Methylomarinum sp. Ch1-1]